MRRLRLALSALLALVLLTQSGLAAAHCLAMAAPAGHAVEICSPDGLRTVRVAEDGTALPDAPRMDEGFCAACPLLAAPALPAPPVAATPAPGVLAEVAVPAPAAVPHPPARAPPYAPRAPPAFA